MWLPEQGARMAESGYAIAGLHLTLGDADVFLDFYTYRRLCLYSIGLFPPRDILMRPSLYQWR